MNANAAGIELGDPPPLVVTVPLERRLFARCVAAAAAMRRDPVAALAVPLFAAVFVAFVAWDATLAGHFSLTHDFAYMEQALWEISRGHLDPWSTVQGYYVWQGHAAIVTAWIFGLFFLAWPHPITILVIQAAAVVGCEAVAFSWMRELLGSQVASGSLSRWRGQLVLAVGLVLLVADPWIVWTISFDFHWEAVTLLPALITLRMAWRQSNRVWIWAVLTVLSSNLGATYVVGVGLSCLVAGRAWRRNGAALLALGLAATVVVSLVHADQGSAFTGYAYLLPGHATVGARHAGAAGVVLGVLSHPWIAVRVMWSHRVSVYADLAVGGLVGVVWPWSFGITAVVLAESGLQASAVYVAPGFQNLPSFVVVPVGTVAVLAWLLSARRGRRWRSPSSGRAWCAALGVLLALAVTADVVGWSAAWLPRTSGQWLRVSDSAATTLATLQSEIPPAAEVIASQGIAGPFADRARFYDVNTPGRYPLTAPLVYVILSISEGIETLPSSSAWATIAELSSTPHVAAVVEQNGVWAYRWRPDARQRELLVPAQNGTVPAWATPATGAVAVTSGPPADWRLVADGPGQLLSGDAWQEGPGSYEATLRYQSSGPLSVLVLDDSSGQALGTAVLPARRRVGTGRVPFQILLLADQPVIAGSWPFAVDAVGASGDEVSIGVTVPRPEHAVLYSVGVRGAG